MLLMKHLGRRGATDAGRPPSPKGPSCLFHSLIHEENQVSIGEFSSSQTTCLWSPIPALSPTIWGLLGYRWPFRNK